MMMARPIATSPAATQMMKVAKVWPIRSGIFPRREKATKLRLAALSISSIDMKMMIALRRVRTPSTPTENSTIESRSRWSAVIIGSSQLESAEHDGSHHRHEQQHRCQLEGEQIVPEHDQGDRAEVASPGTQRCPAGRARAQGLHRERGEQNAQEHERQDGACGDRTLGDLLDGARLLSALL